MSIPSQAPVTTQRPFSLSTHKYIRPPRCLADVPEQADRVREYRAKARDEDGDEIERAKPGAEADDERGSRSSSESGRTVSGPRGVYT